MLEDVVGQVVDMEAVLVVAVVLEALLRYHVKTMAQWAASEGLSTDALLVSGPGECNVFLVSA